MSSVPEKQPCFGPLLPHESLRALVCVQDLLRRQSGGPEDCRMAGENSIRLRNKLGAQKQKLSANLCDFSHAACAGEEKS
jgi:hypothetical protein